MPVAAGTMRAATAAALPLEEPPGVRDTSHGLRVGPGAAKANSVVTVLPRISAPPLRRQWTAAPSQPVWWSLSAGLPTSMGMSSVSWTSLMAKGMPSTTDRGCPALYRVQAASAALRAPSTFMRTNALTSGSSASMVSRHRSR